MADCLVALATSAFAADEHEDVHAKTGKASSVLTPTAGNEMHGVVTFEETEDGAHIKATVHGQPPDQEHGFHVHQNGDISADDGTATRTNALNARRVPLKPAGLVASRGAAIRGRTLSVVMYIDCMYNVEHALRMGPNEK